MLDLTQLDAAIGSHRCEIRGSEITFHYRQATHPEIVEARYQNGRIVQKMQAIEQALQNEQEPDVQITAQEIERLIRFLLKVVTDVEGIQQDWPKASETERLSLLRLVPELECWELVQASIRGQALGEDEKKS